MGSTAAVLVGARTQVANQATPELCSRALSAFRSRNLCPWRVDGDTPYPLGVCCFSGSVVHVSGTEIFARAGGAGGQYLVYRMGLEVAGDVAMILPLPVPPRSAEDAVRFIDLSGYPELFRHLDAGFPMPQAFGAPARGGLAMGAVPKLEVHQVGDFEASFVPTQKDFARLDERFRLPPDTWKKLPAYADWGFAVFKLRSVAKRGSEKRDYHPMAFDFPRRDPARLFFPTVHIHDGDVHPTALFDHTLYLQATRGRSIVEGWHPSYGPAARFASAERAKWIVDGEAYVFRRLLMGEMANADVVVDVT